ncbi:hypothetical protein GCM10023115_14810 [Pontixanthobacter gangjinensis]|uniref:Uncharacterized protein n=1 Tax=Pontixanthobacter gangjinensis TaxID=1028742 RepID=A0A6I4SNJ7_9SPHN|nr:hypothetical protein [Pontixanthobacter gangjinensis]MXO56726.1 hypothetical protein [Pontixanthobacter gangjinensis]
MPSFAALLAPLALLLPFSTDQNIAPVNDSPGNDGSVINLTPMPQPEVTVQPMEWVMLEGPNGTPIQYQVRIEQRVVIRVSPRRVDRQNLNAEAQQRRAPQPLIERKVGKCLKMNQIAGVQTTRDNRLMLYMRDKRLIVANLEKACSARDFYSGFYVEPNKDGNLCIDRDKLQSRTGVKCELSRIRQLIRPTV